LHLLFSRPTHEYLGYGAGTDFDRKIVAKVHAPELLRKELMKRSWKGEELVFSFTSDPYLPLEAHYKLTRGCLEVCLEFRNPLGIITKSALIRRDLDLLRELARETSLGVFFTIPFTDREAARAVEPFAPLPEARFHAMADLAAAGIEVGIGIAPVIPGLTSDIPELLKRAKEAGAKKAFMSMLRLPGSVAPYFEERLREKLPTKADRILNRNSRLARGKLNSSVLVSECAARANTGRRLKSFSKFIANALASIGKESQRRRPAILSGGHRRRAFCSADRSAGHLNCCRD